MSNDKTTQQKELALAEWAGLDVRLRRRGPGNQSTYLALGEGEEFRPATDRNDIALFYPVLEEGLWASYLVTLKGLVSGRVFSYSHAGRHSRELWLTHTAPPATQFEALCRVMEENPNNDQS